jgi:outer membrane protein
MRLFAKLTVLMVPVIVFMVAVGARADDTKIGIVDMKRVIELSDQGKKATKEITSRIESAKKDLQKRRAELDEMKQEIESKSMILTPEALAKKERTYQDKNLEYQKRYDDYEHALNEKSNELDQKMSVILKEVVEKIGAEGGYSLILELTRSGVLYYSDDVDITDLVIEEMDKR